MQSANHDFQPARYDTQDSPGRRNMHYSPDGLVAPPRWPQHNYQPMPPLRPHLQEWDIKRERTYSDEALQDAHRREGTAHQDMLVDRQRWDPLEAHIVSPSASTSSMSRHHDLHLADGISSSRAYSDATSGRQEWQMPEPYQLPSPSAQLDRPTNAPRRKSESSSTLSSRNSGTSRKHECHICHKLFPRPTGLSTHMNSHTGEQRQYLH